MKRAFLSSFLVYLAPLVDRHGFSFRGAALIGGWTRGPRREPRWVVWSLGQPPLVLLRVLGGAGQEKTVSLGSLSPGSFVPLEADLEAGVLTLVRNSSELFEVKLDGVARQITLQPGAASPLDHTIRRLGDGWVVWDGYRDREAYRLAWSLPAGSGVHRVTKGRGIQSAAVHPDGKLLALSVSGMYSIGEARATSPIRAWTAASRRSGCYGYVLP
jgi:hypothetical protein